MWSLISVLIISEFIVKYTIGCGAWLEEIGHCRCDLEGYITVPGSSLCSVVPDQH